MKKRYKKGDWVQITSGKFRGVQGSIFNVERSGKETYFDIFAHSKARRGGRSESLRDSGLGMVVDIEKKKLKKLKW